MASKYKVLPLDGRGVERLDDPAAARCPRRAASTSIIPGTGEVEASNAVDIRNRSYSITAEVEIPKGGAKGVLLAHGGSFGGYTFFVNKDQKLQFSHNYLGLEEYKVVAKEKLPEGKLTVRLEFQVTGAARLQEGHRRARRRQAVHRRQAGRHRQDRPSPARLPTAYPATVSRCGRDTLTPVSADYGKRIEYPFTGTMRRVIVEVAAPGQPPPKAPNRD